MSDAERELLDEIAELDERVISLETQLADLRHSRNEWRILTLIAVACMAGMVFG